jgi:hypothetical protein
MLAMVGVAVGCLLVLGFYGYVFMQLYREHKRFGSLEKRLHEHLCAIQPEHYTKPDYPRTAAMPKIPRHARKESLLHVGVAIGGLLGVFAEIGLLNWLVTSFR